MMNRPTMNRPPVAVDHPILRRIRRITFLLDNSIPIPLTRFRIGLDPLLGLIPGGGDVAGAILSAYIVFEGARLGLPQGVLMQMLGNLLTDTALGALPLVGDLFDATWKANSRNVALMEAHAERLTGRHKPNYGFMLLFTMLLILFVVIVGAIAFWTTTSLLKLITHSPN